MGEESFVAFIRAERELKVVNSCAAPRPIVALVLTVRLDCI
jgi:hypothetical protein